AGKMKRNVDANKDKVLKYEFWGLVLLVAIPLPGTGAYTGAMVAAMVDMQLKRAVPAILIGVIIAAIIVSFATAGVVAIS
ncbi:MAG: small multi-drug export protein, partial [Firmicutes bacterium]|nr:small multi-drug export protein [Bacillota bacterium]